MNEADRRAAECSRHILERDQASQDLSIQITDVVAGEASAVMTIEARMMNAFGICHGGYIFMLADTAFQHACNTDDNVNLASSVQIDFLRPAQLVDRLTAEARQIDRIGRSGIFDVSVVDQDGQRVAVGRARSLATNRPLRGEIPETRAQTDD